MSLAEIRKGVIAVLGAITAVVPQVLASLAGVIPVEVASWLTIIASIATAVLVYLVPNEKRTVVETVQSSVEALSPALEEIKQRVIRETVEAWKPALDEVRKLRVSVVQGGSGGTASTLPWVTYNEPPEDPEPPADPFVVPPLGR